MLFGFFCQNRRIGRVRGGKLSRKLLEIMKARKCKPSAQFAYNYTINVLSKCSNIISHRSLVFEVDTMAIDLRRSAHRSSIFEGRHIYHRSLKVDTSIVDLRKLTHRSSKIEGGNIARTIRHRILSTTAIHSYTIDIIGYVSIVSTVIPRIPRGTHNIGRRYTCPYMYTATASHVH